ncbi:MAG: CoA transferase [Dehalococcoidia bacterium]|nr:CoA transferase [Dehalococcoidia bacterium]
MAMPLSGVRVLDLTQVLAGPFGSRTLADLGAEVIKVETPGIGDSTRYSLAYTLNGESFYFLGMNRNKKGITLNLKSPKGQHVFHELARKSDVVFSNFRPGVLANLGVDYPTLRKVNPRIICCAISGFGSTGPEADRPAFDPILQGMGGVMSMTGEPGGRPMMVGFTIADLAGGHVAVQGILAALYAREHTGEGQEIDISLFDVQLQLQGHIGQYYLASGEVLEPLGSYLHINIPAGSFKTRSGYIVISCSTQKFYENLVPVVSQIEGFGFLASDTRFTLNVDRVKHKKELIEILERAFQTKTTEEWLAILKSADVPAGPILTIDQALSNPQAQLRHMVVEAEHPVAGRYKMAGNPVKMSQIHKETFLPAPMLGQHTEEVLTTLLGYSSEQVSALRREGVV